MEEPAQQSAQAPQPQPQPQQPPVQVQPPNLQRAEAAIADGSLKDIPVLLKEFAKRERCDRYSADGEKIKLITDYLWIRQLVPTLLFETFLDLYAVVADFDDDNMKHPEAAIKMLLPRAKSQADKLGVRQWKANEVVDYLAVYIDMVRAAETTNTPIPMTLNQFLASEPLREAFFRGDFKSDQKASSAPKASGGGGASAAPKSTSSGASSAKKKDDVERPTAKGDRCIFSHQNGRQYRGFVENIWTDTEGADTRIYVDFKSDAGEEFKGTSVMKFEKINDPPPKPPINDATDAPKPECGNKTLTIRKAEYGPACQCLALNQPVGTVETGDNVYNWHQHFDDGYTAVICVVNGETKPYVDAFLCKDQPSNVIAEIPPRENLAGTYQFDAPHGVYTLEVKGNE